MEKIITAIVLVAVGVYFEVKSDNFVPNTDMNCKVISCTEACTVWGVQVARMSPDNCIGIYDCNECLRREKLKH
jgi:hypothetical protein